MRVTLILILFFSVVINELVEDLVILQSYEISQFENLPESKTEKENQESSEDESEFDFFDSDYQSSNPHLILSKSQLEWANCSLLASSSEIHSPPPEL